MSDTKDLPTLAPILGGGEEGTGILGNVGTVSVDVSISQETFNRLTTLILVAMAMSATIGLGAMLLRNQLSK